MDFQTILYNKSNRIATVTMNRPEVRNAQNWRMIEEMDKAFLDAEQDDEIKVVILEGAGPSFSSGHDLKVYPVEEGSLARPENIEGKWLWEREHFFEKSLRTWRLKKPVIAKVQGHCLAAGFMLANLCDLIVAADNAKFGDPVARQGGAGVEMFVHPWAVPPRKAKELLFTGDSIDAETAYQLGMVNHVVPLDELNNKTMELAEKIANVPSFSLLMIKNSINRTMDMMGFYNSINAFFDTHIMVHWSDTSRKNAEARKKSENMKDYFNKRDSKFN
jgi:enoyl-CoA hydratase